MKVQHVCGRVGLIMAAAIAGCGQPGAGPQREDGSRPGISGLPPIIFPQGYEAARASSHDPGGGNVDSRTIAPGETLTLAALEGPGLISHVWLTIGSKDPAYLSNLILQIRWDGAAGAAVDAPVGPFFALGHNEVADVVSAPVSVMAGRASYITYPPGLGAFNGYFPMAFRRQARITVQNNGPVPVDHFYYHIDWRRVAGLPEDVRYFHARYHREQTRVETQPADRNLTGKEDYVILETGGAGHYVGCTLHVEAHAAEPGKWYEGDETITVDGQPCDKGIQGTGTEDYFNMAWGVRRIYQAPYYGSSYVAWNPGEPEMLQHGRFSVYRWHLPDPVPFQKSIRVSIEHGHNNDAANRYASVAYWYAEQP
jgi:hypothetical protein